MDCPKCGTPMEQGIIYTEKYPYFTKQEAYPVFRAPKDRVILRPLGDTSTGNFSFPFHDYSGACLCRTCGLAVIPFQKNEL